MSLTITESAEKFIRRMVRFSAAGAAAGFRLCVSPGGCSGLASQFSVEAAPLPGDSIVERQGLKLFLPAESRRLLEGVTIDFVDAPLSSGFVFHDPKASGCGSCGSSASSAVSTVPLSSIQVKSGA